MRRRFYVVLNPTAGVPRQRFLASVLDGLAARGATVTVVEHADPVAAAALVRAAMAENDVVVAAGGDGTIRLVASALADGDVPLGIIPLGTGNVFAREIGLDRTPAAVVDALLDGPVVDVNGARANGVPFFLMAGVGFDARTVALLDQGWKRRLGRAAYSGAVMQAWRARVDDLAVEVDGKGYAANWLIVTNGRHYGGSFVLSPAMTILKPGLEAILICAPDRYRLVEQLARLALGRLTSTDNGAVTVLPAKCVRVAAALHVPVQVDGDRFGTTPLEIDANGPQIRLIVPRVGNVG